ncbi:hypothetical protein [Thermococcus sp. Bubb.Bath]|uniref:hypothetical protein n=1 Tax=Thermococcus sp. Bubb.Bath TaxID=1638242 RepID=UPI00143B5160|nr:hypothetical protein [Thermococcus sp. Bubb.Bath]NJF24374.1 hypothetical protein [Thermococcus sp. Bubb.Bath]
MKARFTVFYCIREDGLKDLNIKGYLKLFGPDVQALTDALFQIAQTSEVITVLRANAGDYSVVYVVPGEVKGVQCKEAYEFLVQKEMGLSKVAEEIAGKNSGGPILSGALILAGIAVLFYTGYHYHMLSEMNNLLLLFVGLLLSVLGGLLRGYQKKRVRISAPRHWSE